MKKYLSQNKGSTFLFLIAFVGAMSLLVGNLSQGSISAVTDSKRHANIDKAYFSAYSAINQWFIEIQEFVDETSKIGSVNFRGEEPDKEIINLVDEYLRNEGKMIKEFDVAGDGNLATIDLKEIRSMDNWNINFSTYIMQLEVGMLVSSAYSEGRLNASNQEVFARKTLEFRIAIPLEIDGPILTLGDLMIDGRSNTGSNQLGGANSFGHQVNYEGGVVRVYGTFPQRPLVPQMYHYGGVMAVREGYLRGGTNSKIITSAKVRTGLYDSNIQDYYDGSAINLVGGESDIIAQGVIAFGANTYISTMGDVYTFDDVEINGSNSVIIINGNYFGLQSGGGTAYHDSSSALVNSAPLHNLFSEDSYKSRIVVNGDIFINGATYRIDPNSGITIHKMEEASFIMDRDTFPSHFPFYAIEPLDLLSTTIDAEYKLALERILYDSNYGGNSIYIQLWGDQSSNVNGFFNQVRNVIEGSSPLPTVEDSLRGVSSFFLGANNRIYTMHEDVDPTLSHLDITTIPPPTPAGFVLDDALNETWNNNRLLASKGFYIDEMKRFFNSDPNPDPCLTKALRNIVETIASPFFNYSGGVISHKFDPNLLDPSKNKLEFALERINEEFEPFGNSISVDALINGTPGVVSLNVNVNNGANVINIEEQVWNGDLIEINVRDLIDAFDSYSSLNHYLIINNDLRIDLVLSTGDTASTNFEFSGLIFTKTRVIVENATINGAIIAAGRSFTDDLDHENSIVSALESYHIEESPGEFVGYMYIPKVLESGVNQHLFEQGFYAGVLFRSNLHPGREGQPSNITFTDRENLFDSFNETVRNVLYLIF